MNKNNFYCQRMCGDENFSIDEWNQTYSDLEKTNLSKKEKTEILLPEVLGTCDKQCFDCMASVGSRRLKTQALIDKQKVKH